jgi:CBS domain-containing protein/PII-like signaling protein
MENIGIACRVRMYLSESDTWRHQPTSAAVLEVLRRQGGAGATVFKGLAGFGVHGTIHTANLVDLAGPLPIVIEWIDTPERVELLLPRLAEMVDGMITVEEVGVAKRPHRALRDVPPQVMVREVMTPVDRLDAASPQTSLRDLVEILLRKRRNAIPIVDQDQRVVGIVTNRDLVERGGLPLRLELLRALGAPEDPAVSGHLAALHGEGRTAESIMTRDVTTIAPDVPLPDAAQMMLVRRLKRLPVVDHDGRLLGMVSRFDVLRTARDGYSPRVAAVPSARAQNGHAPRVIGEVMSRDVPTVTVETSLPDVLDAVMATRLHRAVVVDEEGRPIGGVVDTDLMQRVTPAAHPGLMAALMRRVRSTSAEERDEWRRRTAQVTGDVMRPREALVVVSADAPIADVIDQALAHKIKLVVVTDADGKVVGMADRADLLGALLPAM